MTIMNLFSSLPKLLHRLREAAHRLRHGEYSAAAATALFSAALLLLFPLYLRGGYARASDAKFELYGTLLVLWAAALLRLRFRRRQADQPPLPQNIGALLSAERLKCRLPELLLLLWLLLAVISSLCSDYGLRTLLGLGGNDGLLVQALLLLTLLGAYLLHGWRDCLLPLSALTLLLLGLTADVQLLGYDPLHLYPSGLGYYDGGVRYVGQFLSTVGNIDMLAAVICLLLPLTVCELRRGLPPLRRLIALAALLNGLFLIFFLKTEGALLGLLAAALLILLLRLPRRARRMALLLLLILLIALLIALYGYNGAESGTLWEAGRILHGDIRDEFGSHRIEIWRAALEKIREAPWLGSGCGTEKDAFSIRYSRVVEATGKTLTARLTRAHSEYLSYALELGIPAALCYTAALLISLWQASRLIVRRRNASLSALTAALLAYAVQAAFNYRSIVIAPLMFAVWGWLRDLTEQGEESHDEDRRLCAGTRITR